MLEIFAICGCACLTCLWCAVLLELTKDRCCYMKRRVPLFSKLFRWNRTSCSDQCLCTKLEGHVSRKSYDDTCTNEPVFCKSHQSNINYHDVCCSCHQSTPHFFLYPLAYTYSCPTMNYEQFEYCKTRDQCRRLKSKRRRSLRRWLKDKKSLQISENIQ